MHFICSRHRLSEAVTTRATAELTRAVVKNSYAYVGMMHTGPCYKRYESITEHQLLYGDLPVDYMYGIIRW